MSSKPTTSTSPARTRRRRRRPPLAAAAFVLLTAIAGATVAEAVTARDDDERHPAPGRVLALPDGEMHLQCSGPRPDATSPVVVLEAGLGEPGVGFAPVQEALAGHVRVCSYDRAGYGWSARRDRDWSADVAARELEELLTASGETGPRLLVAHSIGGFVARSYALQHPDRVAGVVLLDPTDTAFAQRTAITTMAVAQSRIALTLNRLGIMRVAGESLVPSLVGSEPPTALMERLPGAYPARSFSASIQELHGSARSAAALERAEDAERELYGSGVPVTVISAGEANKESLASHRRFASLAPAGVHLQAPSGGHYVHYEHSDLVVDAVLDVLARR